MIIAKSNTHTKKCFTQVQIIHFLHCKKLLRYNEILPDVSVLPFYCSFSILPPNQELVYYKRPADLYIPWSPLDTKAATMLCFSSIRRLQVYQKPFCGARLFAYHKVKTEHLSTREYNWTDILLRFLALKQNHFFE